MESAHQNVGKLEEEIPSKKDDLINCEVRSEEMPEESLLLEEEEWNFFTSKSEGEEFEDRVDMAPRTPKFGNRIAEQEG